MSEKTNQIEKAKPSGFQHTQVALVSELEATYNSIDCDLTDYGKQCAMNAIQGAIQFLANYGKGDSKGKTTLADINVSVFKANLQSVALLELNYGASPSEIYFDIRGKDLTIKPQGAGYEKLVRTFGVGVAKNGLHSAWVVREGDDFELPTYDGLKATAPKWKPKSLSGKPIFVVYPLQKSDGSVEWLMADRESIKPNIVAQIRQNALYAFKDYAKRDAFYDKLNKDAEKLSVDELLSCKDYADYINPTYTSYGSKEAMIIRKMKNRALANYPKEFNGYQKDAVSVIYEDRDDSVSNEPPIKHIKDADVVEKVEKEINEKPQDKNAVQDFEVNDDGEIVQDQPTETEPKPVEKPTEPEPTNEPEQDAYDGLFD